MQVELARLTTEERFAPPEENVTAKFRAAVESARERQLRRFTGTDIPFNAAIPGGQVQERCAFSAEGMAKFKEIVSGRTLSTRSMDRLAKVARTIADLEQSDAVEATHLSKASRYVIGGILRDAFQ